jgi:hypothetical protein
LQLVKLGRNPKESFAEQSFLIKDKHLHEMPSAAFEEPLDHSRKGVIS